MCIMTEPDDIHHPVEWHVVALLVLMLFVMTGVVVTSTILVAMILDIVPMVPRALA